MPRHYLAAEKQYALHHLDTNEGNFARTATETGIPVRTLYRWHKQRNLPQNAILWHKDVSNYSRGNDILPRENPMWQWHGNRPSEEEQGEYTQLRRMLMHHIFRMTQNLSDDPDTAHLRAIALTRLLDRVIKLQTLTRFEQSVEITVTRIDPVPPGAHSAQQDD